MTEENYYIAYYQSVIERNVAKAAKLYTLSDKEEEQYPNEYPELSYNDIFNNQDPDEAVDSLLKSQEYKEFFLEFLSEFKSIAGNYYIAFYQIILDQNFAKLKKIVELSSEDKKNYPNEYPELNYDDIFHFQDPEKLIINMINNNHELNSFVNDVINPLATEETLIKREENFQELMKHPLIDYCPNPDLGLKITDNLVSSSYSQIFNQYDLKHSIIPLINKSPILAEIFSSIAISTTKESIKPFSIAFVGEGINNYDPTFSNSTGGYHHPIKNTLVVTNKNNQIHLPFLVHELSHKLMNLLFNDSNPYPENSTETKEKYHQAIRDVLLNIKQFIKDDLNLDISIKDNETTWDIGKKLCAILFPQYIDNDKNILKEVISILNNNNIDTNNFVPWLDESFIEKAAYTLKFETADLMIKNGFKLSHDILITGVNSNIPEIIDWYLEQENINPNFKNNFGNAALGYAKDPKIIKTLIAAGTEVYSSNYYDKICTINPDFKETEELSPVQKKQLDAIQWFLMLYLQSSNYNQKEEDCEFIVRLPQIIAQDLYHGKVVDILAPMLKYWEEIISPAVIEYQTQNDPSDICLPLMGNEIYYEICSIYYTNCHL